MDGCFLLVMACTGEQGIATQPNGTTAPEPDPGLEFGFEVGGGEVVVGERGILRSDGPSVLFVAADGIGRCSALVPMAINVARERKV